MQEPGPYIAKIVFLDKNIIRPVSVVEDLLMCSIVRRFTFSEKYVILII